MKNKNLYKAFFLFILILLPWSLNTAIYGKPLPPQEIVSENIGFYQTNTCRYSLGEIFKTNTLNHELEILPDLSSKIECFGKINGVDMAGEKIKVYVGTNPNIDFLLQSIFWLLIISFVPKSSSFTPKYPNGFAIFIMSLLLYLHLSSESKFYISFAKSFNTSFSLDNFLLASFIIVFIIILNIFLDLLNSRFKNFVNYLPYIFLFTGSYNSLNVNFFLLLVSLIGIIAIQEGFYSKIFTVLYASFSIVHLVNFKQSNVLFDVDKLKGFINSSQNTSSLLFWLLIMYLFLNGAFFIFYKSREYVDIEKIKINFLISGSLIVLIGILSSLYNYLNYFSYYYLGLNKLGIKSFDSIDGNTWRGISPSAEAAGEYFAFSILFWIVVNKLLSSKISLFEGLLVIINLYGLFRSNNFAAAVSLVVLTCIFYLNQSNLTKRLRNSIYVVSFLILIFGVNLSNEYSYDFTSKTLLHQGITASLVSDAIPGNEYGLNAAENSNFGQILLLEESDISLSTSLRYALTEFTENGDIRYIPDKLAVWSVISVPINRSEKWGIFLAKYNPNLIEVLFGYGPQQLSNYYLGHPTMYNDGLVLPHSSLLDVVIFYGLFGLLFLVSLLLFTIFKNRRNMLLLYPCMFILLNYVKSDSILYLSSFTLALFVFSLQSYKLEKIDNFNSYA